MPATQLYTQIRQLLDAHLDAQVDPSSRERLTLLVMGILEAKSASPARIAQALKTLGLSAATVASLERRVRRIENDPELSAALCVHPLARVRLRFGKPHALLLVLDPTTQDDRVVMLTAGVWYRGRALPLAWAVWPANQPLEGERFWERVAALLAVVADLLPRQSAITWLADRAFGSPAFTDLLMPYGWGYLVRVQGHTVCRDRSGVERAVATLVPGPGCRAKLQGQVFKKRGWRQASVVVLWGARHREPLCLVSNRPPRWALLHQYQRRYAIETLFRDYKSHGWQWEQGQVTDLEHLQRLLVGMALATWMAVCVGTQVATELLAQPPTGHRRTCPWEGKRSLATLGLQRLDAWLHGNTTEPLGAWQLANWEAPNWHAQLSGHHARAYVLAARPGESKSRG